MKIDIEYSHYQFLEDYENTTVSLVFFPPLIGRYIIIFHGEPIACLGQAAARHKKSSLLFH